MNVDRFRWLAPLALLLGLGLALAPGCEPSGTASCEEECESDDDCESGLSCFGDQCLPSDCDACFEDGRTCYYDENTAEQAEGESVRCDFRECG